MSTYLWLDTLNLNDQVNYSLGRGWRPRVARRRKSGLGGWLYEDVVESIPLRIFSKVSLDDCLDARDAIIARLDRAERWGNNEAVDVILLKYAVDGSSRSTPLQSEVREGDGGDLLELGAEFNEMVRAWEMQAVLRLKRRGEWLDDEDSATSSAGGPATLLTCTLAESIPLYSPLSVELAGMDYSTADGGLYEVAIPPGVLLIGASGRLWIIQAEEYSASLSSAVTDVVDATASDGVYIRMSTGQHVVYTGLITAGLDDAKLIGVWAMCHLTSATDKWSIESKIYRAGSEGADESTQTVIIDGLTDYRPVRLGILVRPTNNWQLKITATRISGFGSIEFDVMGLIALDSPSERVIATNSLSLYEAGAAALDINMGIRHNRLSEPYPAAYVETETTAAGASWPYEGNIHLTSIGDAVVGLWLAGGEQWQHNDDAGVINVTLTASRRRAYLAPR